MGAMEPENQPVENEQFSISPEDWQEVQETIGVIREAMQYQPEPEQQTTQQQQTPQIPIPDPFSENYPEQLQAYTQAMIEQATAPLQAHTEEAQLAEAEETAMSIIESLASEKGQLPEGGNALVRSLANEYVPQAQEQFGFGPQAAEAALAMAFDRVQEILGTASKSYHETQMNELANLGQAPRQPENNTPAAQGLPRTKGDEMSLVRNFFER